MDDFSIEIGEKKERSNHSHMFDKYFLRPKIAQPQQLIMIQDQDRPLNEWFQSKCIPCISNCN